MITTVVKFTGGGPSDGGERSVPDAVRVICFPRVLVSYGPKGPELLEDSYWLHAYHRKEGGFKYAGPVELSKAPPNVLMLPRLV